MTGILRSQQETLPRLSKYALMPENSPSITASSTRSSLMMSPMAGLYGWRAEEVEPRSHEGTKRALNSLNLFSDPDLIRGVLLCEPCGRPGAAS